MTRRSSTFMMVMVLASALGAGIAGAETNAGAPPAASAAMNDHMAMTEVHPSQPGDRSRADAVLAAARAAMRTYPTVADAERAGFKKFLPNIPLPLEHYTNDAWAREAWSGTFDPTHPTSLIFRRSSSGLSLAGVMYTAAKGTPAADLNARVPLSVARWHRHVDYCFAPKGSGPDPRFGLAGSITTRDACVAAGGTFVPQIFGWMVHVWPNEHELAKIWAVEDPRSGASMTAGMHDAM